MAHRLREAKPRPIERESGQCRRTDVEFPVPYRHGRPPASIWTGKRKALIMSASVVEAKPVLKWRVVDIAVASVIGVASALIYWAVAFFSAAPWSVLEAVIPGLAGIFNGLWLFAEIGRAHV